MSDSDSSSRHRAKQIHSVVERRYRNNLNGKIEQLSQTLRATGCSSLSSFTDHPKRVCKSDVLNDAINYIYHSEVEMRHMSDEIRRLNKRVEALRELARHGDLG
jgi:hypothetical protein